MRQRKSDKHLPPSVYLKHGAYWHVQRGKWHRLGADLTHALAEYGRRIAAPAGGMSKLIDEALPSVLRKNNGKPVSSSTDEQYRVCANLLQAIFKNYSPSQVKPKDVTGMKRQYADRPNMGNRMLSVLRKVFDYALEQELVESNPCVGIKRYDEETRDRLITEAEWNAIYAKAVPQLQCIMDLAYATGQRIMDVVSIKQSDLVDAGIYFKDQKTGGRRIIRWTTDMRAAAERAKGLRGNVRALTLFHGRRGTAPAYKTIYDKWTRACELAGVMDANLHDMRAKAATDTDNQGGNAQALLGHSSPAMTKRYLRSKQVKVVDGPIRQPIDDEEKAG